MLKPFEAKLQEIISENRRRGHHTRNRRWRGAAAAAANEYRVGMYAQLNPTLMATINIRRFATGTPAALTPHYHGKNQSDNPRRQITQKRRGYLLPPLHWADQGILPGEFTFSACLI